MQKTKMKKIRILGDKEKAEKIMEAYENLLTKKDIKDIVTTIVNFKGNKYSLYNKLLAWSCYDWNCMLYGGNPEDFKGVMKGFNQWSKEKVKVNKGSKALNIIIPLMKNREYNVGDSIFSYLKWTIIKVVSNDGIVVRFNDGSSESLVKLPKQELIGFKAGNVFDISQTEKHDQYLKETEAKAKEMDEKIYKNMDSIDFEKALKIVENNSKAVIKYMLDDVSKSKGSFNMSSKEITLYEKEAHTLLHEYGHYLTDGFIKVKDNESYAKNEILAELFCYLISIKLGVKEYNFNYSNIWSNKLIGFEFGEFEKYFTKIDEIVDNLRL